MVVFFECLFQPPVLQTQADCAAVWRKRGITDYYTANSEHEPRPHHNRDES